MRKSVAVLFITLSCTLKTAVSFAVTAACNTATNCTAITVADSSLLLKYASLPVKEFEKVTGHRLKFKEKIALKLWQLHLKKVSNKNLNRAGTNEKVEKKALWAKWLGIGSLIGLIIPGVGLLSLPAAIIAIVLGANTLKRTKDPKNSRQGITFGIITLSLILIIGFIVALVTLLPVA